MNQYKVQSTIKGKENETLIAASNSFEARKKFAKLNDLDILKGSIIATKQVS